MDVIFDGVEVKRKRTCADARLRGARKNVHSRTRSSHTRLSAVVPAFAEPDIHLLSRALVGLHR